jgi:hypothetical protein
MFWIVLDPVLDPVLFLLGKNPVARGRIELPTPCFSDMGKPFKPIPF